MIRLRDPKRRGHPAVRQYLLLGLFALLVLMVALSDEELKWRGVLPLALGSVSLITCWSLGPPLILVLVTGLLLALSPASWMLTGWDEEASLWRVLATCLCLLTYVICQYRLLALMRHIFPPDLRRQDRRDKPLLVRRSPDHVGPREMTELLIALPVWTGVGLLGWVLLHALRPRLGLPSRLWQAVLLVWVAAVTLALSAVLLGYLRRVRAGREESLLYLQDQLWLQTRPEQTRLSRWLARARLRRLAWKEKS